MPSTSTRSGATAPTMVDVRGPRTAAGMRLLGLIATGFAPVAAFLNAAFGICLGCQIHPLVVRVRKNVRTLSTA